MDSRRKFLPRTGTVSQARCLLARSDTYISYHTVELCFSEEMGGPRRVFPEQASGEYAAGPRRRAGGFSRGSRRGSQLSSLWQVQTQQVYAPYDRHYHAHAITQIPTLVWPGSPPECCATVGVRIGRCGVRPATRVGVGYPQEHQ